MVQWLRHISNILVWRVVAPPPPWNSMSLRVTLMKEVSLYGKHQTLTTGEQCFTARGAIVVV